MKKFKYVALALLLTIVIVNKLYWQESPIVEIATIDCFDLGEGCYISTKKIKFKISSDAPIQPMKQFTLHVKLMDNTSYQPLKVSYNMNEMDMGLNEYLFSNTQDMQWGSVALIPLCISGISNWVATVVFENANQEKIAINVNFNVGK